MIEINLIPEHLRKKRKGFVVPMGNLGLPQEAVIGLMGGLIALLLVITLIFQVMIFIKWIQRAELNAQWKTIAADKETVDLVLGELRALQGKINSVEKITTEKRISWAQKLNDISDSLPRRAWLNKISLDQRVLLIDGNAVSKMSDDMMNVGSFTASLKDKKSFMSGLENIEVGSIQRRQIKSVDVVDFLITVKLQ